MLVVNCSLHQRVKDLGNYTVTSDHYSTYTIMIGLRLRLVLSMEGMDLRNVKVFVPETGRVKCLKPEENEQINYDFITGTTITGIKLTKIRLVYSLFKVAQPD